MAKDRFLAWLKEAGQLWHYDGLGGYWTPLHAAILFLIVAVLMLVGLLLVVANHG